MSLPHDIDAEMALLGAILYDNEAYRRLSPKLRPEHFYEPVHGRIFAACAARIQAGQIVDAVTLREQFAKDGALKEVGGAAYLATLLQNATPLREYARQYGDIIRALARRRALIAAAQDAIALAESGEEGAQTALERRLDEISGEHEEEDAWAPLGVVAAESVDDAQAGKAQGVSTGIEALDACTGGFRPGTVWVVGGATSMGKSVVGAALSRAIAAQGLGVGEIHLEMDLLQIGLRAAAGLAFELHAPNAHYLSAQRQRLTNEQWARLRKGVAAARGLPIHVDARPGRSLAQIEASARRLFRQMRKEGVTPGALLIDHEGLIAPAQRFPSELEAARARAAGLLDMAKRLGVCVIALSQITKEGARHDGASQLPTANDLNFGGALSQAAQVVILLHRKAYYAERKPAEARSESDLQALQSRETILVVDKARGGQRKHVTVCLDLPTAALFEPMRGAA